ncbi:TPA: TetR/AcrR family transcriptional regulator [Klebsiella pneumoniae]|nr:TetR/AcrR family transcriptional regulator [Klebsiella pneumoniae]HDQ3433214.1 TetR/AcrR family transcriptional regulator [Klebsiella pneumoniae]
MDRSTQILDATKICVQRHGFHNASIKKIAKCAGVSTGLIYRYYKNKEDLIEALVKSVVDHMIRALDNDSKQQISQSDILLEESSHSFLSIIQDDIFMIMDIAAEAFRNEKYREIISDSHCKLLQNIINHEKKTNSSMDITTFNTRNYFLSILIDGLIVQRIRKGNLADDELDILIKDIVFHSQNP